MKVATQFIPSTTRTAPSLLQNLMQDLQQVLQAVDVTLVRNVTREDMCKVNHLYLHVTDRFLSRFALALLPVLFQSCQAAVAVGLLRGAPNAIVLFGLVVAPAAAFLVQGVHGGEALIDVVVLLTGLGCDRALPQGLRDETGSADALVDEEQRACIKVEPTLALKPLKDLLDFEDAGSDGVFAENVAVVEELG